MPRYAPEPGARLRQTLPFGLVAFCLLWRLPTLGDPPWLNDEGVYANVGKAILQGEALYRQVWENKPPAIYLLYGTAQAVAGSANVLFAVRLLALAAALIAQTAIFRLVRSHAGYWAALLGTACAGAALDLPLLDGTTANAEIYLIAATTPAMATLWKTFSRAGAAPARRVDAAPIAAAGVAFGVAILFKLVAGTDLVAALAVVALACPAERRLRAGCILLAGTALPIAAALLWLAGRGLLGDALYATVGYNEGYVSTGQSMHAPLVSIGLLAAPLMLLLLGIWVLRRTAARRTWQAAAPALSTNTIPPGAFAAGSLWWLGLALLGALASGRSYLHYYLQAVPPAAICLALLAGGIGASRERLARRLLAGVFATWIVAIPAISVQAVSATRPTDPLANRIYGYYGYAWQHLTGAISDSELGDRMDARVERNVATARYLRGHPALPRRLYVWGNAPWIYYLSGYEHATRYFSAYYRPPIPGGMDQVAAGLRADPPPYIVVIEPELPTSASLEALLRSRYHVVWRYRQAVVFRLRTTVRRPNAHGSETKAP